MPRLHHHVPATGDPVGQRVHEWMLTTPLRLTETRLGVVRALQHAPAPLNAEALYREVQAQGSGLGIATIYRVLRQLEEEGLVRRELPYGAPVAKSHYSIRLGDAEAACWLQCPACGSRCRVGDRLLVARLAELARQAGYGVQEEMVVRAPCAACAASQVHEAVTQ